MSRSLPPRGARGRRRRDLRRLTIMEAALVAMPALRREIFLAVRLDAMTHDEVAQRTGLSVRAVEREIAHVLRALGNALRQDDLPNHRGRSRQLGRRAP